MCPEAGKSVAYVGCPQDFMKQETETSSGSEDGAGGAVVSWAGVKV